MLAFAKLQTERRLRAEATLEIRECFNAEPSVSQALIIGNRMGLSSGTLNNSRSGLSSPINSSDKKNLAAIVEARRLTGGVEDWIFGCTRSGREIALHSYANPESTPLSTSHQPLKSVA